MMKIQIVILAAGKGRRMRACLPKALQPLGGIPALAHLLNTIQGLPVKKVVMVHRPDERSQLSEALKPYVDALHLDWVEQKQALGTGHALKQAFIHLEVDQPVLVLLGDVPLLSLKHFEKLIAITPKKDIGLLTSCPDNPLGLGRIVRNTAGHITDIVEEKDANIAQKSIREVFTGSLYAWASDLSAWMAKVNNHNKQKEYYLPSVISIARHSGRAIHAVEVKPALEAQGMNTLADLAQLERFYQKKQVQNFMQQGVRFADPSRFDLRGRLSVGKNVFIDVGVVIEGDNELGDGVSIGPYTMLRHVKLAAGVRILSHCVVDQARLYQNCQVGPFAHIRGGSILGERTCIGNFVEVKNSCLGEMSKAKHLSYLGDADIENQVNIGAGTIICNYDGQKKHSTKIKQYAFIGSGSQLVAPLTVGESCMIGAGSTITKDVPDHSLTLTRSKQRSYKRRKK